MFIAKNNDLIILAKDTREELEQALQFMVYTSIEETDIDYQLYNGEYLTPEEIEVKERQRRNQEIDSKIDDLYKMALPDLLQGNAKNIELYNEVIESLTNNKEELNN